MRPVHDSSVVQSVERRTVIRMSLVRVQSEARILVLRHLYESQDS